MKHLRIGLAQVRQSADLDDNAKSIFRFLENAASKKVQVLCFPETQTVGYRVDVVAPDAPVQEKRLEELHADVARRCGELGMACILG
ncbi:MAG: nitrilase-related carbon-nitrogen hydrolase, partial [Planctomycetota bacterium]|nr:nitrilase-related carbon-nitrogen hydrolase [Planctomycetota bacterium]